MPMIDYFFFFMRGYGLNGHMGMDDINYGVIVCMNGLDVIFYRPS